MRISSIGLAGWGLAGGITAAAVREWTPEGPTRVLWLSLAMVVAWRMGRAAARAIASAAGAGTARAVLGPPAWPPPSRPPPGSLLFPTGSRRRARLGRMAVILALTGLTGSWVGAYRIARQAAALREFEGGRVAWVGGFVAAPPQRTPFTVRIILHPAGLSNTPGRVPQGPWTTLPGAVQVEVPPQSATNVVPGAWVAVRGLVKLPEEAPYPGAFSPRRYLNARGVVLAVKARSAERVIPGTPPAPPPVVTKIRAAVLRAGIGVADRIRQRVGPVGSRWLLAVGLGKRDALTPSQQEALQAAGLGHLLSVSGVHVGLVAGPFVALARRMARSRPGVRPASAGAAVAAGWLYAAMTGLSAPAVRASMVQTVALAVWAAGRRAGLVDALGVAGAVQLLSGNPHLGSDPGFQMSYVATLGIGLFLLACDGRMQGRPLSHGLWLFRVVQVIGRQALVALGISASAWACVSPLVMAYFGRASVVGALMSVPAAPLCGVLLWSGLVALFTPIPLSAAAASVANGSALVLEELVLAGQSLELRWGVQLPVRLWMLPAAAGALLAVALRAHSSYGRFRTLGWGVAALVGAILLSGRAPAGPQAGSLVSTPAGQGWVAAGLGPDRAAWLVVKLRDEQELEPVLYKTAGVLAGLGRVRAELAVAEVFGAGEGAPAPLPAALERFGRVWVLVQQDGGFLLSSPGFGAGQGAAQVEFASLRLIADGRSSRRFRLEMGGAGSVRFDLEGACLRPAWSGRQVCRRDGTVSQLLWEAGEGDALSP